MRHPWRWVAVAFAAGVTVLAVVLALTVRSDPHAEANTSRLVGKPAPALSLRAIDGTPVTSESLAGKTVVVNFWNTWCIPCRRELPALKRWYASVKDRADLVFLGIVREDDEHSVREYVRAEGMRWLIAFDPGGRAALDFGTRGQPETYAIGPDGVIAASIYGPVTPQILDRMVARAQGTA